MGRGRQWYFSFFRCTGQRSMDSIGQPQPIALVALNTGRPHCWRREYTVVRACRQRAFCNWAAGMPRDVEWGLNYRYNARLDGQNGLASYIYTTQRNCFNIFFNSFTVQLWFVNCIDWANFFTAYSLQTIFKRTTESSLKLLTRHIAFTPRI